MKKVMKTIFFEVDVHYLGKLCELQNDLPLSPEKMKTEKLEKIVANLHDKAKHVVHIRNLKRTLNHG